MTLRSLIQALSSPEAYPHRPVGVEVLQTHISVLFFAGERVFKVKKPVRLGFVDFAAPGARLEACREEVRLNAELAPGVYLGVAPIYADAEGAGLRVGEVYGPGAEADPAAVEHAVVMRRLPRGRMLDELLERGEIDNGAIDRIVEVLARFHGASATGEGVDEYGEPERVWERVARNLRECEPFAAGGGEGGATVSMRVLRRLRACAERFIEEHRGLMRRRVLEGRVREGHGDLHAGNICVLADGVVIYDRIEFAKGLRCGDVASDVAFLAMDLDARGARGLSGYLAARYAQRTGDAMLPLMLTLYKMHLAAVRGKVASIRSREGELTAEARRAARGEARRYFQLAAGYTLGPGLVLMCGLPGTGKSSAARAIAGPLGAVVLRSDEIRKRLSGMAPTERWLGAIDGGIYTEEVTERTYRELLAMARGHLEAGRGVIVDATFRSAAQRAPFLALADAIGVPGVVAHLTCPEQVVEERLARRARDPGEVSDADMRVYRRMRAVFEAPAEVAPRRRVELTCEMEGGEMAGAVVERLVELME